MVSLSEIVHGWKDDPDKSRRIIALGASNTDLFWHSGGRHNWVDWLNINIKDNIGRHVIVINQGIFGETTEDLMKRFDRDVLSFNPEMAIITIGGNDFMRGLTCEQFTYNLKSICTKMLENSILPILQTYYCPLYHTFEDKSSYILFESFMEADRTVSIGMDLPSIDQYSYFEPFYTNHREEYIKIMCDSWHVNHFGNFLMGSIASRSFGLPYLKIPEDIRKDMEAFMKLIQLN